MEGNNSDDECGIGLSGILDDDGELATNIFEQQESQDTSSTPAQEDNEVTVTTNASEVESTLHANQPNKATEEPKPTTSANIGT